MEGATEGMTSRAETSAIEAARAKLAELFASTSDLDTLYDGVCRVLNETLPTHNWVGIYLVEGPDLVLAAWHGPAATEHTRIPIGTGICGAAAAQGETIIVPDVNADPRYLQCFLETRSEIVVPIKHGDEVLGEIDVDGNQVDAFGPADQELLEWAAARLAEAMVASRSQAER